jgi:hypothetical protein
MNRKLLTMLALALFICCTAAVYAKPMVRAKATPLKASPAAKATVDTLFYDNFESDTLVWTTGDFFVQDYTYWHISPVNAYGGSGNSWWCGTDSATSAWINPAGGYSSHWVQYLYSPTFDLTAINSDTVLLKFMHYYSVEGPSGNPIEDWDCVNLWGSTDGGSNWFVMYPDTVRCGVDKAYNVKASKAWWYMGVAPYATKIPGWGGPDRIWKPVSFDLTAYKGDSLKLRFSVVSDAMEDDSTQGGIYDGAWYLDSIRVDTFSAGGGTDTIFYDDAESGNKGWTTGAKVPKINWTLSANRTNSGTHAWYNGDTITYKQGDGYSDALISPFINLTEVKTTQPCIANFAAWVDMPKVTGTPSYTRDWDYFEIFVSDDSGATWDYNTQYAGATTPQKAWTTNGSNFAGGQILLTNYAGKIIQIKIEMNTDADDTLPHGEGLYLDDFVVTGRGRDPLPDPTSILLVDDDGGATDLTENSWTKYMESSLANLGYRSAVATIGSNKTMTSGYLEQFPVVIWNLGPNYDYRAGPGYQAITANDKQCIMSYLNSGGNLWMSGQQYFYANGNQLDTTVHPNIISDYLHISPENGWINTNCDSVLGVSGDPIGDGFSDFMDYGRLNGGGNYWTDPNMGYTLNPDTANYPVTGFMLATDGTFNGLRYNDVGLGYKFVYTAFPFEAVSYPYKRDTLAARIINWLKPNLNGDYLPPAVPQGLILSQSYDTVKCRWKANTDTDVKGYNVYRCLQSGIPAWTKLGTVLHPDTTYADTTITGGLNYNYAVTAYDTLVPANESLKSQWSRILVTPWKLGLEGQPAGVIPARFSLEQNQPNPFRGNTEIRFALPRAGQVELGLYNVAGQRVSTLASGSYPAGYHSVRWSGRDGQGQPLSNGVYFYRLEARGQNGQGRLSQTKRLRIVK